MSGTKVAYSAEGVVFLSPLFLPEGTGKAPGVLVAHGHSFTNPEADSWGMAGFAYQADSDRRAWALMREHFVETGLL